MKLRTLLAVSAFALSAVVLAGGAEARIGSAMGGDPQASEPRDTPPPPSGWRGDRRQRGGDGQGQTYQPPPPPPPGGNFQGAPGGHRPPPPPPPPGADPRQYGDGYGHRDRGRDRDWGRGRDRDWDRKRRRDRFRDGAAVVLGLGVLGALASQPRYGDPYDGYDGYPPPPPPQPYGPGDYEGYPDQPYEVPGPYAGYGPQPGAGVVRCSSSEYRTQWCPIPQGARVSIQRRLSSASCDFGRDWGVGRGAIWVANGCRAEFAIY